MNPDETSTLRLAAQRLAHAVRDPRLALAYLQAGDDGVARTRQARFVADVLGVRRSETLRLARDLAESGFPDDVRARRATDYVGEVATGPLLYLICRLLGPERVVETGVASGTSSAYILKAMEANARGTLDSIDLPNYEEVLTQTRPDVYRAACSIVSPGREVGWAIPPGLKGRWSLHIGPSSELLPKVLEAAGPIDLFLHDSEHTYETMIFEYRTAWPHLRTGGVLLSDDVGWNAAFPDFAREVGGSPHVYQHRFGALRKR